MNGEDKCNGGVVEERKSGFADGANAAESFGFSPFHLGQRCPQPCPQAAELASDILGAPITIQAVAELIGCSVWTVRQRLLPRGLPHFRIGRTGKLLFYHNQVVRWVLHQQRQKGGDIR